MFYRIKENKLYDWADHKYAEGCLYTDIITAKELEGYPNKVIVEDGVLSLNPNFDKEQEQKEKERILSLSMTRSDFFDGTIKAFGADSDDLLVAIQGVLATLPISDIEKKVAINNYKNALNFYRKHPLFNMLSGVPIPITEEITITITSEQWDRFFETKDYTELLPKVEESVGE